MSGSAAFFTAVCSHVVTATRWTCGWYSLKDLIQFKNFGVANIFCLLTAVYLTTTLNSIISVVGKVLSCPLEWDCLLAAVLTDFKGF